MTTYRRPYPPNALTTQQAAEVLGVSVDTVMRWLSEGRLTELEPPIGSRPRFFARAEVEAFGAMRGGQPLPRRWRGLDLSDVASDDPVRDRFWAKVDKNGPVPTHRPELGPCWVWTEHCAEAGYGQFVLHRGEFRLAHAMSYALTVDPVPACMQVCHHCDNPPCCNPAHLFLGSNADNSRDMFIKGRQGDRHPGSERAVCRSCEVRAVCLDYALEHDERFGIWGGMSERERRRLKRSGSRPVADVLAEADARRDAARAALAQHARKVGSASAQAHRAAHAADVAALSDQSPQPREKAA